MSLRYKLLGKPGRDNGLFVWVESGNSMQRLLFDCGENLLETVKMHDIKEIEHLFLSHLHVDHLAGFDYFFRRIFRRQERPVVIWGPERTAEIIHNRLRGFMWNLVADWETKIIVNEIHEREIKQFYFMATESFRTANRGVVISYNNTILENQYYKVDVGLLNHQIPSVAYRVTETTHPTINKEKMREFGVEPGPLLGLVKNERKQMGDEIDNKELQEEVKRLREKLIVYNEPDSIGYMTDLTYDEQAESIAEGIMKDCKVLICESQYLSDDENLAKINFHLTSYQAGTLAKKCNAGKLIVFHISERYTTDSRMYALLEEVQEVFPNANFPEEWEEWG